MTSITPVAALASTTAAQNNAAAASLGATAAPTESMFLQLLVAQLKHQDPTTPQDPSQFVAELAQFSQLEQTVTIAQNTTQLAQDMAPSKTATTPPTTTPAASTAPANTAAPGTTAPNTTGN